MSHTKLLFHAAGYEILLYVFYFRIQWGDQKTTDFDLLNILFIIKLHKKVMELRDLMGKTFFMS